MIQVTEKPGYDIIGDIHGHADELKSLLVKMGYTPVDGCYRHPTRKVIFLGDFIDRGPDQSGVLNIVMAMVRQEVALAVMGNHEFNALAFHTEDPDGPGTWLRTRNKKNLKQHEAFLAEYFGNDKKDELAEVLEFFYTLPLWLELDGLRVIHAAWDPASMEVVRSALDGNNLLTRDLLVEASRKGTDEYEAVEILLKGLEHELPAGLSHKDKDGTPRTRVRLWFFEHAPKTLRDIIVHPHQFENEILDVPASEDLLYGYSESEPPVFVGHYWMKKDEGKHPARLRHNVACLDYSVAKGGELVAYRWSGEKDIDDSCFVY